MRRLRELGFDVALDDFGPRPELAHLPEDPAGHVPQIDGTFVRDVVGDDPAQAMLSPSCAWHRPWASGPWPMRQSDAIRDYRCASRVEFGQGFSIGRPAPLEKVISAGSA